MYDEPARVADGIVTTVIGLLVSIVAFVAGFAISGYLIWKITLVLSFVVPALYYLASRFTPKSKAASELENEEEARLREVLGKSADCYKTVKVFGLYPLVYGRVLRHLRSYLQNS